MAVEFMKPEFAFQSDSVGTRGLLSEHGVLQWDVCRAKGCFESRCTARREGTLLEAPRGNGEFKGATSHWDFWTLTKILAEFLSSWSKKAPVKTSRKRQFMTAGRKLYCRLCNISEAELVKLDWLLERLGDEG